MKRLIILFILIAFLVPSVRAAEYTAPTAPDGAQKYMPDQNRSFGEDLWSIIQKAIAFAAPDLSEAANICLSLVAVTLLTTILKCFSGNTVRTVELSGTLAIGLLLLQPSNALLHLGIETTDLLGEYGMLLLPVMSAASAAQGSVTGSAALYTGTAVFNSVLSACIATFLVPMSYIYLALSLAINIMNEPMLEHLRKFLKWLMSWGLKIVIYLFTGYLGITRVIGGAVDASAIKATKLAISGMIPVVGKIVSDASDTILISAGIMKNAAGMYGMLAILSIFIGPFIKIGIQYLLLKMTSAVCGTIGGKGSAKLIQDFSVVMGYILAAVGTISLLFIVSTACFMKEVA